MNVNPAILKLLIRKSLRAVDPVLAVKKNLHIKKNILCICNRSFSLARYRRLHVLGAGKASPFLYEGIREIIGDQLHGGIIVSLPEHSFSDDRVAFMPGSHPLPDARSLRAGKAMVRYIRREITPDDLVIFLLTGGASSLLAYPHQGITLTEKRELTRRLLLAGAPIKEINCVRKAFSRIKGGRLAELMQPATLVTLVISDVINSPLADIGSGPTIRQNVDPEKALRILKKYGLLERFPSCLEKYLDQKASAVPGAGEPRKARQAEDHHAFILSDNHQLLAAASGIARQKIPSVHVWGADDRGEARKAAKKYAALMHCISEYRRPFTPPVMLLAGGELTVTVKGRGKGGRNQEFLLALVQELKDMDRPFFAASIASDGIDGSTDAAGAWIDHLSYEKAREKGLAVRRFLAENDSYHFFREMDQLIKTGPTRTNVMDLRIFYVA